jgi:hypothetical protein
MPTDIKYRPASTGCFRSRWASSAWSRPGIIRIQLSMLPALGALAAGNRVMIKPSELAPRTAALMARIVREYFADDEMAVFPGDADVGKAFTELPFDHLFFTGSTPVGRPRRAGGREEPDAGHARARRQVAGARRRQRLVRFDRAEDCGRQAVQCGPDLHRAGLCAGAA